MEARDNSPSLLLSRLGVLEPQKLVLSPVRNSPDELDPVLSSSLVRTGRALGNAVSKLTEQLSDGHTLRLGGQGGRNVSCGDRPGGLGEVELATTR